MSQVDQAVNTINEAINQTSIKPVVKLGYPTRRTLEPHEKIAWKGNADRDGMWKDLTPFLKQVDYREVEGGKTVYEDLVYGVCPNDECYSHIGKERRTLRIRVHDGFRASVYVWCDECSYDGQMKAKELVEKALGRVKREPEQHTIGTDLSTVETKPIEWLWERRIPLGKVILLDGDPGLGKSVLMLDLVSRLTRGKGMPDSVLNREGGVVMVALEDTLSDVVVPRLEKAGADLTRVTAVNEIPITNENGDTTLVPFNIQNRNHMEALRGEIRRKGALLVYIDNIMSVLGENTDSHKDQSARQALMPLVRLADEMNVAVVAIRHENKGKNSNPLYRGGGSIAFIGLARVGLMVVVDPEDEGRRVLINSKNNLSKAATPLVYEVVGETAESTPNVKWHGMSKLTFTELTDNSKPPSANKQLILRVLRDTDKELTPTEVHNALPEIDSLNTVKTLLRRMAEKNEIVCNARGLYTVAKEKDIEVA